ncbi:MAG: hypothetical protein FWE09_00160 [Treponema sp.]|nr:hypothetical protein [Treponema sp.]
MTRDMFGLTDGAAGRGRQAARAAPLAGRDLYTTRQEDVGRFLDALERDGLALRGPIWEPAAGLGDISKVLARRGHEVLSSDAFPYSDGEVEVSGPTDFLAAPLPPGCRTILTNPPFNALEDFLLRALSHGTDVVFVARLGFLSSERRRRIFSRARPAFVYVFSKRAKCLKDGIEDGKASMVDYCVAMFRPPHEAETALRWIE